MEVVQLGINEVKEWEHNARIHTKRNLDTLKQSLQSFDQYKPLIIQKSSMRIIAGNGTYAAAVSLGWDKIYCNIVDVDDQKAEAMAIADNRTGLLSQWDEKQLTESLKSLQTSGDLNLTGFDDLELDKMLSFQDGSMFEKIIPDKKPEKAKESDLPKTEQKETEAKVERQQPKEQPIPIPEETPNYDEQINFTICGFVFSLANLEQIQEISCLMNFLKDAPKNEREEISKEVFDAIQDILTEKFMR